MKWYNYKSKWINLEMVAIIIFIDEKQLNFWLSGMENDYFIFNYENATERDAEFEKIKELIGVNETKNNWTPGRCC